MRDTTGAAIVLVLSAWIGLGVVATRVISTARAESVPPQLVGKTIYARHTSKTPLKLSDGSVGNPNSRTITRTIYISSAGRIFEKVGDRRTDGLTKATEREPQSTDWNFQGRKMSRTAAFSSGATLYEISFNANFQSCTFAVTVGAETGQPYRWRGLDGKTYTAAGPTQISNRSCSIVSGNRLAD